MQMKEKNFAQKKHEEKNFAIMKYLNTKFLNFSKLLFFSIRNNAFLNVNVSMETARKNYFSKIEQKLVSFPRLFNIDAR